MTNKPVTVVTTPNFRKQLKRLRKKYQQVEDSITPFIDRLEKGETPGDQVSGVGYTVYKVRLRNKGAQRGKSGGFRVIYYLQTISFVVLITIYAKSEQDDVSDERLRKLIEDLKTQFDDEAGNEPRDE